MLVSDYRKLLPKVPVGAAIPTNDVFVSFKQLREHGIPFSRRYLRTLVARGLFPVPKQIGANRIGWLLSELNAWKASRPVRPVQPLPDPVPTGKRKGAKKRRSLEEQRA